jgi:hypothetical protein
MKRYLIQEEQVLWSRQKENDILLIAEECCHFTINDNNSFLDQLCMHYYKRMPEERMRYSAMLKFCRDFDTLKSTSRSFFLILKGSRFSEYQEDRDTNVNFLATRTHVEFCYDMFQHLAVKLYDFVEDMQVNKKHSIAEYIEKIDTWNGRNKKKIDKAHYVFLLKTLESHSLDALQGMLNIPESTLKYMKKRLKQIGFDKNTVSDVSYKVRKDFYDYYMYCFQHQRQLFTAVKPFLVK